LAQRTHLSEDPHKLKNLLLLFKKKYDESLALLDKEKQFQASHELASQEQAHLFNTQIQQLNIHLEEVLGHLAQEKQKTQKLGSLLQEKEDLLQNLDLREANVKRTYEQKQKLEESIDQLEIHKNQLEIDLGEGKQRNIQLERAIQHLQKRLEEAHLEARQYENDYLGSQSRVEQLDQQLQQKENDYFSLQEHLAQAQQSILDIHEEQEFLQKQLIEIKNFVLIERKEKEGYLIALQAAQQNAQELQNKKDEQEKFIQEQQNILDQFERDLFVIKQSLVRGYRETKEVDLLYQEAMHDRAAFQAKFNHIQRQWDQQQGEVNALKNQVVETSKEREQLYKELQELHKLKEEEKQQFIEKEHNFQNTLKARVDEYTELQRQIAILRHNHESLQNELLNLQTDLEEREDERQQAQSHMAKKVKEAAQLAQELDDYKKHSLEQQQLLHQDQIRIAELQTGLEFHQQQQKRLQEQLQEASKAALVQQENWDQKYLAIFEKAKVAESRLHELEKLEEKQKHLQGLLANMGSFLGPSIPSILAHEIEGKEPSHHFLDQKKLDDKPKPYQDLFNIPSVKIKPKQNLLDE
jgi:chromosome segregation ATPase